MTVQGLTLLNDPARLAEIVRRFPYDERDYPLLSLFPAMGYRAGKLTWKIVTGSRGMAKLVANMNTPGHLVQPQGVREAEATPMFMEEFHNLENEEVSLLRAYDSPDGADPQGAQRALADILAPMRARQLERKHWACTSLLRDGSISYDSDGVTFTVSYGLTALTIPGTSWADAGADIIADIHLAIIEFTENAGYAPDSLYFDPKLFPTYLIKNTKWLDLVKSVPGLAQAVLAGSTAPFQVMGIPLTWKPVSGQYQNDAGSIVDRWDPKKITLVRESRTGRRDFEWGVTLNEKNKYMAQPNAWAYGGEGEMMGRYKVVAFDCGLPIVKDANRIQTWQVVPA